MCSGSLIGPKVIASDLAATEAGNMRRGTSTSINSEGEGEFLLKHWRVTSVPKLKEQTGHYDWYSSSPSPVLKLSTLKTY